MSDSAKTGQNEETFGHGGDTTDRTRHVHTIRYIGTKLTMCTSRLRHLIRHNRRQLTYYTEDKMTTVMRSIDN